MMIINSLPECDEDQWDFEKNWPNLGQLQVCFRLNFYLWTTKNLNRLCLCKFVSMCCFYMFIVDIVLVACLFYSLIQQCVFIVYCLALSIYRVHRICKMNAVTCALVTDYWYLTLVHCMQNDRGFNACLCYSDLVLHRRLSK